LSKVTTNSNYLLTSNNANNNNNYNTGVGIASNADNINNNNSNMNSNKTNKINEATLNDDYDNDKNSSDDDSIPKAQQQKTLLDLQRRSRSSITGLRTRTQRSSYLLNKNAVTVNNRFAKKSTTLTTVRSSSKIKNFAFLDKNNGSENNSLIDPSNVKQISILKSVPPRSVSKVYYYFFVFIIV
jgi:hypothetical protein